MAFDETPRTRMSYTHGMFGSFPHYHFIPAVTTGPLETIVERPEEYHPLGKVVICMLKDRNIPLEETKAIARIHKERGIPHAEVNDKDPLMEHNAGIYGLFGGIQLIGEPISKAWVKYNPETFEEKIQVLLLGAKMRIAYARTDKKNTIEGDLYIERRR